MSSYSEYYTSAAHAMREARRFLPATGPVQPLDDLERALRDLRGEVAKFRRDSSELGTVKATLQVNFGKEVGRICRIADPKASALSQLVCVLEHLYKFLPESEKFKAEERTAIEDVYYADNT